MSTQQITYLVFGVVVILALFFDLYFLIKKNKPISIKTAFIQTVFWVLLALAFFVFLWFEDGHQVAIEYLSAYLMEWSLSIDNIFVFILIFSTFKIKENRYGRTLLIGILMAILLRVIFITVGVTLVEKASWILYLFGAFLLYTGYRMFTQNDDEMYDPKDTKIYKFINTFLPITLEDINGKYFIRRNGKPLYTVLFVVIIMLAVTDLVFALDSIPAVMGISTNKLVIYTSNIFAVLGLRSLFFLLQGAVTKFDYLQQGIAIILIFIGAKMLTEHWLQPYISKNTLIIISLAVIVACLAGSIIYSIYHNKKQAKQGNS